MTVTQNRWSTLLAIGVVCSFGQSLTAGEWPTFRGKGRTAVAIEGKLLGEWPEGGPKVVWETAGAGRGYASFAIQNGKLFTLGDGLSTAGGDKDEFLSAFDLNSGKQIWTTKTGPAWNEGPPDWQSSRSTPTADGDRVYVITPKGVLVAASSSDGKIAWTKNLGEVFHGKKGDGWGYSESPLIDGDRLICTPGGDESTMVALNKANGELIWKSAVAGDRGAGHSSIVISQVGKKKIYVQTTASGALGVSAADGKLLWTFPIDSTTCVIPTPIVRDDYVFFSAGYKRGGAMLKQVVAPSGDVSIDTVYGLNTKLANKHGGIVLVGDYLYGDSDDAGQPFCADLMTGEIKWVRSKGKGSGKGSAVVIAGDGKLYVQYQDGTFALVDPNVSGYREISAFTIPGSGNRPSWAHPVILDGKLYVRQDDKIVCYNIAG